MLNLVGQIDISPDGKTLTSFIWEGNEKKTIRLTMLTDDDSLKFRKLKANETVLDSTYTKYKTGDSRACDTEQRVVIEANSVTNFNVAVVFEMLGHKDEAVGYEKVAMSEWTTTDDEWLNEANKDVVYPGQAPTYKYQASDFARANRDLANAGDDFAKIGQILTQTSVYLTDYDPNNASVAELVEQYMQYVKRYNYEVERMNAAFMDIYFGFVPANPASTSKDEGL